MTSRNTNPPTEPELAQASLVLTGQGVFGQKLWTELGHKQASNALVSPFSITTCLSLLRNGMGGPTADDLGKALGSNDLKSLNSAQSTASRALVSSGLATVSNAIFARPDIKFSPEFEKVAADSYGATVEPLKDLGPAGVQQVNNWVSTNTKGRIPTILDSLGDREMVILLNAITFDGLWEDSFKEDETKPLPFATLSGSVNAPLMHREASYQYAENEGKKVLEIPYKGGQFSMLVMLPKEGEDPDKLIGSVEPFAEASKLASRQTDVLLPKFKYSDSYTLNEPLSKLGLGQLFEKCDFTPMVPSGTLEGISRVLHKTYIEVDEKGTKAAAVTGIVMRATAIAVPNNPKEFHADRPFAFWILHKPTHTVMFFGTVKDPTKA